MCCDLHIYSPFIECDNKETELIECDRDTKPKIEFLNISDNSFYNIEYDKYSYLISCLTISSLLNSFGLILTSRIIALRFSKQSAWFNKAFLVFSDFRMKKPSLFKRLTC